MKQSKVLFSLLVSLLGSGLLLPMKAALAASAGDAAITGYQPVHQPSLTLIDLTKSVDLAHPSKLTQAETIEPGTLQFNPPVLGDRRRPGGRPDGGASRGGCTLNAQQTPLTALVPTTKEMPEDAPEYDSVFSLTSEARPAFWFYVPYELNATPLELVIQDENNNTLFQQRFTSSRTGTGIIQVRLPDTAPELQLETLYHWYFLAYCDENNPAFVEGWIERTPLDADLASDLTDALPREQTEGYADNGIWHEALTTLGQQYLISPNDPTLTDDWNSLLESINLEHITEQPLIDCCVAAPTVQP